MRTQFKACGGGRDGRELKKQNLRALHAIRSHGSDIQLLVALLLLLLLLPCSGVLLEKAAANSVGYFLKHLLQRHHVREGGGGWGSRSTLPAEALQMRHSV